MAYVEPGKCRVCMNDRRFKSLCKRCTGQYVTCRYCLTEHPELTDKLGIVRIDMAMSCKVCGPSPDKKLDFKLLKQKNNSVVKDSFLRRRIS